MEGLVAKWMAGGPWVLGVGTWLEERGPWGHTLGDCLVPTPLSLSPDLSDFWLSRHEESTWAPPRPSAMWLCLTQGPKRWGPMTMDRNFGNLEPK